MKVDGVKVTQDDQFLYLTPYVTRWGVRIEHFAYCDTIIIDKQSKRTLGHNEWLQLKKQ